MNITAQEITDKQVWESFNQKHSPQALFQSWLWGEVQKAIGQSVERIGFYHNQSLVATAQIVRINARRGRFLHVRHGPIVSQGNEIIWQEIIDYLKEKAKKESAWFVRLSPLIPDTREHLALCASLGGNPAPIHAMDGELCWVVDLTPTEKELFMNMRKSTRYEIRQGQKIGVEITMSSKSNDLNHFYQLYEQTARRHRFVQHTGIKEEFALFVKNGQAALYNAYFKGQLLAAAIILRYNGQTIYHHSASLSTKIPAMSVLLWKAMLDAKTHGDNQFNFWGIAPEDNLQHPWRGITLFKKGFGGREISFLHAWDLPVSPFYVIPHTIEAFRRWRKGY